MYAKEVKAIMKLIRDVQSPKRCSPASPGAFLPRSGMNQTWSEDHTEVQSLRFSFFCVSRA